MAGIPRRGSRLAFRPPTPRPTSGPWASSACSTCSTSRTGTQVRPSPSLRRENTAIRLPLALLVLPRTCWTCVGLSPLPLSPPPSPLAFRLTYISLFRKGDFDGYFYRHGASLEQFDELHSRATVCLLPSPLLPPPPPHQFFMNFSFLYWYYSSFPSFLFLFLVM